MGGTRFSDSDFKTYSSYSSANKGKSVRETFKSRSLADEFDPLKITMRESCDSDANPNATPIIIAFDVSGSMGDIANKMATEGLGTLVKEIYDRKPVSDPHICCMAVGDAAYDSAPLQVTQFEADLKILDQLTKLYVEGGGGGNDSESYTMPWYFAANKTKIDSMIKRNKKGILFTIGDEELPSVLPRSHIQEFIGDDIQYDVDTVDLLNKVSENYDVFHIIVEQGSHARADLKGVKNSWLQVLGDERVIMLSDYTKLAEVVVSALQVHAGENKDDVTGSWDGTTGLVVQHAISGLARNDNNRTTSKKAVVKL